MKKILLIALFSMIANNAFANIYCAVPYAYPGFMKFVQKFEVNTEDGINYNVVWPVQSACNNVDEKSIECAMIVHKKKFVAEVNIGRVSVKKYTEAGKIKKSGLISFQSPLFCLID